MTKFIIILIVLYIVYYAGNIIYDLFLKTNSIIKTEDNQEFSLVDFEEENRSNVKIVGIEDVENLITPKSYNKKQFPIETVFTEERQNMDHWRERFESEQNIDSFEEDEPLQENVDDQNEKEIEVQSKDIIEPEIENNEWVQNQKNAADIQAIILANSNIWKKKMALAETTVNVVDNMKGQKVYHSSLL